MARVSHDLTRAQRANLRKLADYLESLPEDYVHFDMAVYIQDKSDDAELLDDTRREAEFTDYAKKNGGVGQHGCGTVACAVGHGPAAGVLFRNSELDEKNYWDDEQGYINVLVPSWDDYSRRFAPHYTPIWNWLFGAMWEDVDNHHWGAAARIRYALAGKPLPEGFGFYCEPAFDYPDLYAEFRKQPAASVISGADTD